METEKKKELSLIKRSTSYKIIIPAKVERLIRFLCERVWDTEWSGILFYTISGTFENKDLEVRCEDIFPMDIGSTTYTEFDMSPDVISYMAQKPELLDCKIGLIHSHNNMSTFFSGTDTATLKEEGADRNHFVSLIVNNAGKYTAAITRKIKYKSIRELSYETFGGVVTLPEKEETEGEEIEYFNLDIVFEEEPNPQFNEVADRLKEIKEAKAKQKEVATKAKSVSYTPTSYGLGSYYGSSSPAWTSAWSKSQENDKLKEPSLFDNYYDDFDWNDLPKTLAKPVEEAKVSTDSKRPFQVSDEIIDGIVNQLITGSITVTKLDEATKRKMVDTIVARFDKRFGKDDVGEQLFTYWATDFVEFLLWYSVGDGNLDEVDAANEIADRVVEELNKFPSNRYIDEYISLFITYADRT